MSKEKITSQEIIDLIAQKASISKRSADEFLKMLITTIEESLIKGESVKIQYFGTFKLQWNEPRKSVDVNTGQEIIIEGYNKVTFVPESSFKELINEPFAFLEAVVMDETSESEALYNQDEPLDPLRTLTEQADEIKNLLSEIQAMSSPQTINETNNEQLELPVDLIIDDEIEWSKIDTDEKSKTEEVVASDEIDETPDLLTLNDIEILIDESDSDELISPDELITSTDSFSTEIISDSVESNRIDEPKGIESTQHTVIPSTQQSKTDEYAPVQRFVNKVKPLKRRKTIRWVVISTILILLLSGFGSYFAFSSFEFWVDSEIQQTYTAFATNKTNFSMTAMLNTVTNWFKPASKIKIKSPIITEPVVNKINNISKDRKSVG
jgi:nucleoid DNA-binding protein